MNKNKNKNKNEILKEIIELESKCGSIIDAIITICERYSIEIETISHYIKYSKNIKDMLHREGLELNLLTE